MYFVTWVNQPPVQTEKFYHSKGFGLFKVVRYRKKYYNLNIRKSDADPEILKEELFQKGSRKKEDSKLLLVICIFLPKLCKKSTKFSKKVGIQPQDPSPPPLFQLRLQTINAESLYCTYYSTVTGLFI